MRRLNRLTSLLSGRIPRALLNRWHAGALGVAVCASLSHPGHADVTLTDCSLAALRVALADGGTILFDCSGTNVFTQPITIAKDTVLDANGHRVVISGSTNNTQLFRVQPGVAFTLKGHHAVERTQHQRRRHLQRRQTGGDRLCLFE